MKKHFFAYLFFLIFIQASGQVNLNSGLVGYYPFNNNANDASGNNYNGILRNGTTFTADRLGNANSAAYFDGNDDYIEVPNNGAFSPRKGFSFVVQFKTESPAIQTLLDKRDLVTGTDVQLQAFINWDQQPGFGYGHNYTNNTQCDIAVLQYNLYVSTGVNTINQNEWYCVIGTFDGTKQNIYLNGVLMDSKNTPLPLIDSCKNIPFIIGRHSNDYNQSFKGTIDEVRVYNRALTIDEINSLSPCKIAGTEICNNGLDDDGDGLIDCADPDCLGCSTPCGPIPSINPKIFNTANNGQGGLIPLGAVDQHWKVSDALNGTQKDAIYTGNCVPGYWTPSPYPDAGWIIDKQYGVCGIITPQNSQTPRYFSTTFDVPASLVSSLKLSFDVYADNYVGEVYLNGVPQGISKTGSDVFCAGCNLSFTLNNGFVAGTNTLTILVTQLPLPEIPANVQYMGFLLNASSTLDSDGDGVPDGKDICPGTPAGVSVDANGCFKISFTKKSNLCQGDSLVLESSDAGTGSTYQWITPGGQILTGKKIVLNNLSSTNAGKYKLEITDSYSCLRKDSLDISLNPKPVISLTSSYSICQGSSVQLNASGGNSYQWYPSTGLDNPSTPNPLAAPSATTSYKLIVINSSGCIDSSSTIVTVNAKPVVVVSPDTATCIGKSIQLNASGGNNYQWVPSTNLSNSVIPNPVAMPATTTNYKVIVTAINGCKDSANTNITINPIPLVTITPSTNICSNDSIQLNVSGGVNYSWSPAIGLNNTTINNPKAFILATTNYQVTVINSFGCIDSAKTTITLKPKPIANVSANSEICAGKSIQLIASGGNNYQWLPGAGLNNPDIPNPVAAPTTTTNYTVIVFGNNGCKDSANTIITVQPKPVINISSDKILCSTDSVQLTASGGIDYQWSPDAGLSDNNIQNPKALPLTSTTYQVIVTTSFGCIDSADTKIQVNPKPTIEIKKSNDIDCSSPTTQLTITGATSVNWRPSQTLDKTNASTVVASPTQSTIFYVDWTDPNGCTGTDSLKINVKSSGNILYLLPNSFTPNSDGINDCFGLKKWGGITLIDFSVFNRWGDKVFTTTDPTKCWDGTFKGEPQPLGTFVYYVKAKTLCGDIFRKGTVTIIR